MAMLKAANLAVRFLLELCLLAALGWSGFQLAEPASLNVALAVIAPLLAALVWGAFVAPRARIVVPDWAWLAIQLLLFGLAIAGLAATGQSRLAAGFAVAVAINLSLVVLWRQREIVRRAVRER